MHGVSPRRMHRVAALMRELLNDWFRKDSTLYSAINSAQAGGAAMLPVAFASVTEVSVSRSLEHATVRLSVYADERTQQRVLRRIVGLQ